ncbi:flagellin [Clostridium carboxidivorans P7]|uniref:Flagellin n=1 Tax=Clostridium carboxidivorans P7 TaxID=536227 RepID=C6PPI6_9CLOT|nr:flagellin [Clostridium carboxidivorans]AKN33919.1 flagellin [Clostridium carboxidivorans P7]EET88880.1 flagellin domain protein [Clostridium carboxidivorans P7]EFG88210.1 flagellin protein [Clostridium carboxidivorans P7]
MIINHNMNAMNAHRNMAMNTNAAGKSMEKLSSGLRINRAGDDAAGLAISEKMRGQIRGFDQASRNGQDSISLIQTAEGALNETHSILQRMRELAVQSANDTNTSTDRTSIQDEIKQLTQEVNRIANTTEFNTKKLLNGDLKGVSDFQKAVQKSDVTFANGNVKLSNTSTNLSVFAKTDVIRINFVKTVSTGATFSANTAGGISITTVLGNIDASKVTFTANGDLVISDGTNTIKLNMTSGKDIRSGDTITISVKAFEAAETDSSKQARAQIGANAGQELGIGIGDMSSKALGLQKTDGTALDVTSQAKASGAVTLINNAIERVSTERSKLGAFQNRLEHTINNLNTSSENLQASESRVRDVDMANEMTTYSKNNILTQAAQAMLAQAKSQPEQVLQLLR